MLSGITQATHQEPSHPAEAATAILNVNSQWFWPQTIGRYPKREQCWTGIMPKTRGIGMIVLITIPDSLTIRLVETNQVSQDLAVESRQKANIPTSIGL